MWNGQQTVVNQYHGLLNYSTIKNRESVKHTKALRIPKHIIVTEYVIPLTWNSRTNENNL